RRPLDPWSGRARGAARGPARGGGGRTRDQPPPRQRAAQHPAAARRRPRQAVRHDRASDARPRSDPRPRRSGGRVRARPDGHHRPGPRRSRTRPGRVRGGRRPVRRGDPPPRTRDRGDRPPGGARAPIHRGGAAPAWRRSADPPRPRGAPTPHPPDGARWHDAHRPHPWQIRYLDGVAMLTDEASARHTHSGAAMDRMLEDVTPDLVFADHGFAGAAIERGVDTVSIADVNDPALLVAQAQGRTGIVIVMDDNVAPQAYWPCFQAIAARLPWPHLRPVGAGRPCVDARRTWAG